MIAKVFHCFQWAYGGYSQNFTKYTLFPAMSWWKAWELWVRRTVSLLDNDIHNVLCISNTLYQEVEWFRRRSRDGLQRNKVTVFLWLRPRDICIMFLDFTSYVVMHKVVMKLHCLQFHQWGFSSNVVLVYLLLHFHKRDFLYF